MLSAGTPSTTTAQRELQHPNRLMPGLQGFRNGYYDGMNAVPRLSVIL